MPPSVDIVLPNGLPGSVPEEQLSQALAAGAKIDTHTPGASTDDGGLLGMGAAAVLGAGSTATLGATDRLLREGSYVLGGTPFEKEVTRNVRGVREANPGATMAGELGGFLLAPESIAGAGEAAAAATGIGEGAGLLGAAAKASAKLAAESAVMGAQRQITEDALGDHQYNAEAVFSAASKDALIGGAIGAPFGALGYGASKGIGLLGAALRGPASHAALDGLAGVEGAGPGVRDQAARVERTIGELRAGGATSEQAATAVDNLDVAVRAKEETAPWAKSIFDPAIDKYTSAWGPDKAAMDRFVADRGKTISEASARTEQNALRLRENVTDALRNAKDVADNVQYTQRPDRFAKLVDATKGDAQADAIASLLQETDKTLASWESMHSQGGEAAGSVRSLRKLWLDLKEALPGAKRRIGYDVPAIGEGSVEGKLATKRAFDIDKRMGIDADAGLFAPEGKVNESAMFPFGKDGKVRLAGDAFKVGAERVAANGRPIRDTTKFILGEEAELAASRSRPIKVNATFTPDGAELNTKANAFKQALDRNSSWGRGGGGIIDGERFRVGIPGATQDITRLADSWRTMLEDTGIWGKAGEIQARSNHAVSELIPRERHLMGELAADIDVSQGMRIPEGDYAKAKGFLEKITGNPEVDEALQPVISARRWIDGMRERMAALREGGISEAEAAKFENGAASIESFEKTLNESIRDAAETNRIKAALQDERSRHGLGGILGLFGDAVTKPLTTLERVLHVQHTVAGVESAIRSGLRKALERGGGETVGRVVETAAPRAKGKIIEEIESIRGLASNPAALESAAARMVGDLAGYAPKTANEIRLTAMRTLLYLAREAPRASTTENGTFGKPTGRYSDIQIHDWETKRNAAFDNRTVIHDLEKGVLNRNAIAAAEFAQPKLFAKMQEIALDELQRMQASGALDRMSYQDKAAYATLLKIAPDETWTPKFMAIIQASKQAPPPAPPPQQVNGAQIPRKSNSKPTAESFMTGAERIESGGAA